MRLRSVIDAGGSLRGEEQKKFPSLMGKTVGRWSGGRIGVLHTAEVR